MPEEYEMRDEYDFSEGEQGKFYRPAHKLKMPVYIDSDIQKYFLEKADQSSADPEELINTVLRETIDRPS